MKKIKEIFTKETIIWMGFCLLVLITASFASMHKTINAYDEELLRGVNICNNGGDILEVYKDFDKPSFNCFDYKNRIILGCHSGCEYMAEIILNKSKHDMYGDEAGYVLNCLNVCQKKANEETGILRASWIDK